jgi:hypothetical protein
MPKAVEHEDGGSSESESDNKIECQACFHVTKRGRQIIGICTQIFYGVERSGLSKQRKNHEKKKNHTCSYISSFKLEESVLHEWQKKTREEEEDKDYQFFSDVVEDFERVYRSRYNEKLEKLKENFQKLAKSRKDE